VPTSTTVPSTRATSRDELLPAEGQAAIATVAGPHRNSRLIQKHRAPKIKSPASRIFVLKEQGIFMQTLFEPNHQLAYRRIDTDKSTFTSLILELDQTRNLGEEGEILSQAYILTCLKLSSALPD
jgi:hypothetical protein